MPDSNQCDQAAGKLPMYSYINTMPSMLYSARDPLYRHYIIISMKDTKLYLLKLPTGQSFTQIGIAAAKSSRNELSYHRNHLAY